MSERLVTSGARYSRGFTLVEVLATLLLVAIVLPAALRAITLSLAAGGNAARQRDATLLAESKLEELVATRAWQDSDLDGDFSRSPSGDVLESEETASTASYRWVATVEDWLDSTVKELTVRIIWDSRGAEREVALTTLVFTEEET